MRKFLSLCLLSLLLYVQSASGQVAIARLKFEDAEEAFNKGDYTTTLSKLEDAEKLFGKINVPILHLRIVSQDKLLQKKLDFTMLANLRKNCDQFLIDYETMEGIEEKYRQVYKIQEAYAKYPKTMEEYQKLIAEKNAEEEAKRELARKSAPVKVYLFRSTGFAASAVGFQVFQDGQVVGRINNKEYLTFDVLPGKHSFGAQDGRSTEIKRKTELTEIDVLPETPVFLEVDYNKWNGDLDVAVITNEKAREYLAKLSPGTNSRSQYSATDNRKNMAALGAATEIQRSAARSAVSIANYSTPSLGCEVSFTNNKWNVLSVIPGSAADKAGIQVGDALLAADMARLSFEQGPQQVIAKLKPGARVSFAVERNGKPMAIMVQF